MLIRKMDCVSCRKGRQGATGFHVTRFFYVWLDLSPSSDLLLICQFKGHSIFGFNIYGPNQGCQIFLCTNLPNQEKINHMTITYTNSLQNTPNGRK
jgi:hypothetical protein